MVRSHIIPSTDMVHAITSTTGLTQSDAALPLSEGMGKKEIIRPCRTSISAANKGLGEDLRPASPA